MQWQIDQRGCIMTDSKKNSSELERQVSGFLRALDHTAARSVVVESGGDGRLKLRGRVKTFYTRQVFVQCCRHIPGITAVVDELHVGQ
jgi:osmotically-inducible protein OsmY